MRVLFLRMRIFYCPIINAGNALWKINALKYPINNPDKHNFKKPIVKTVQLAIM